MKRALRMLLMMFVLATLCGCAGETEVAQEGSSVVIIAGRHANANMYTEEDIEKIEDELRKAFSTYKDEEELFVGRGEIAVIVCDGEPKKTPIEKNKEKIILNVRRESIADRDKVITDRIKELKEFLLSEELKADDEEVDLLGALAEAQRIHEENSREDKCTIILDTGISTAGRLKMQDLDFMEGTVDELIENINVPDVNGTRVVMIGLGNVAGNQQDYRNEEGFDKRLEEFWTKILEKANATLDEKIRFAPEGDNPMMAFEDGTGYPRVTAIEFIKADPEVNMEEIRLSTTQLTFKKESAEFENEEVALEIIQSYAERLLQYVESDAENKLYVVGSIAVDQDILNKYPQGCREHRISKLRAEKIADILVKQLNIPEENLVIIDAGATEFSWRNEQEVIENEDGTISFSPTAQEMNRVVMIIPDSNTSKIDELKKNNYID